MPTQNTYIEVVLMEELFEADTLHAVIQEALRRGLIFSEMRIDPVADRLQWKSREESTTRTPMLYLKKEQRPEACIVQGPKDDLYRMFKYTWIG